MYTGKDATITGRTVQVPAQVNRVIGTGCSCREIVYLNASDKIVGIEQSESNSTGGSGKLMAYMVARPELMSLPVVTSGTTINYEKLQNSILMLYLLTVQKRQTLYNQKQVFPLLLSTYMLLEHLNR